MKTDSHYFSYTEALQTFPIVKSLTATAVRQVEALFNNVQSQGEMDRRRAELDDAYQQILAIWVEEVSALGCQVKGPWLVDWDNGHGYYCWRYPEETLGHYHGYEEGFDGRIPVQ